MGIVNDGCVREIVKASLDLTISLCKFAETIFLVLLIYFIDNSYDLLILLSPLFVGFQLGVWAGLFSNLFRLEPDNLALELSC